jgi:hypothetical protein
VCTVRADETSYGGDGKSTGKPPKAHGRTLISVQAARRSRGITYAELVSRDSFLRWTTSFAHVVVPTGSSTESTTRLAW